MTIPLPPGAAWEEPDLDENGWYGQQAALMMALYQAECAWSRYWDEGDAAQKAEALAGFRQVTGAHAAPSPRRARRTWAATAPAPSASSTR